MAKKKDPFKKGNAGYDTFVNNLYKQVFNNLATWGIDAGVVAAIFVLLKLWNGFWAISKTRATSTGEDRSRTTTSRKNLTAFLRPFVQKWIYRNDLMTDADIIACGLDPYDRVKSKTIKPDTEPNMDYAASGTHILNANYKQQPGKDGVAGRGKPAGVGEIKIMIYVSEPTIPATLTTPAIVDTPPPDPADFPRTVTGRRSPVSLIFNPKDAGKLVTMAACWVSTNNIDGNFTGIQALNIP